MFSTRSDNCIPFVHIFDIIFSFAAEFEDPEIPIRKIVDYSKFRELPDDNFKSDKDGGNFSSLKGFKTLWVKGILFVMSNFYFSHRVFKLQKTATIWEIVKTLPEIRFD